MDSLGNSNDNIQKANLIANCVLLSRFYKVLIKNDIYVYLFISNYNIINTLCVYEGQESTYKHSRTSFIHISQLQLSVVELYIFFCQFYFPMPAILTLTVNTVLNPA